MGGERLRGRGEGDRRICRDLDRRFGGDPLADLERRRRLTLRDLGLDVSLPYLSLYDLGCRSAMTLRTS